MPHGDQGKSVQHISNGDGDVLLHCFPDIILVSDVHGRIIWVNEQISALGFTTDDLIGQTIETLVPNHMQQTHVSLREEYLQDPTFKSMTNGRKLTLKTRDGRNLKV
ncbi:PAS domain S-box protein [Pleionea litopenaei]|uniref:PAS domain S-box protein n=1 Tax=Pleionea litopenaei TaxID=3070815 RepID=A0AA51RUW5_9GAMM|nr:PAS domain S-box protein [Pleionea sp. HL-JVS1]WMS87949.1 PAS domain S-box protein [Pleionea sp. HL-JVS1]